MQSYGKTSALRAKKTCFLHARPSESNFDEVRVTEKRVQCNAKNSLFCVQGRVRVTSVEPELRKKVDFRKQFWRINATKCIDKGISRKNEAIQSEGSTQIWEDCGKS